MFHGNGVTRVAMLLIASAVTANTARAQTSSQDQAERPSWGALDATGSGFLIGRTEFGEMTLSGYAVIRYNNQLPATQTFVDHLGNVNVIVPRNNIQFHKKFNGYAGVNTIGGSRSVMGLHPFWLANDRVMADEFFGPGSFDDWESHERLATRFGVSSYRSRENRFNQNANPAADNYQVKLADSLLLFSAGSAPTTTASSSRSNTTSRTR
jgi:hypothetical protein